MKKKINDLNLGENFYLMTGNVILWPLFRKVDLMIRPTTSDGDAISVREALFFNCPVIASDVTSRPKDVIIFKNRDIMDLYKKCREILRK